jgi:hypothetical protein
MKKIAILSAVLCLQSLNSFGGTNAVPPVANSATPSQAGQQKPAAKNKSANDGPVSSPVLTHRGEAAPEEQAALRRIARDNLLMYRPAPRDYNAELKSIFPALTDPNTVSDTIVTIYPAGR